LALGMLAIIAGILIFLSGCSTEHDRTLYKWTCKVERVEGVFVSQRPRYYNKHMVKLYRFTEDGTRREFMFPTSKIESCEYQQGEN